MVIKPGLDSYFGNEILLTCLWVYFSPVVLSACHRNSATGSIEHFPLFKAGMATYLKKVHSAADGSRLLWVLVIMELRA